jgi:hypothetical protein
LNSGRKKKKGNVKPRQLVEEMRSIVAGSKGINTGENYYQASTGRMMPIMHRVGSKVDALLRDLQELKARDPESKVTFCLLFPFF